MRDKKTRRMDEGKFLAPEVRKKVAHGETLGLFCHEN
jgi:hypothetical protein